MELHSVFSRLMLHILWEGAISGLASLIHWKLAFHSLSYTSSITFKFLLLIMVINRLPRLDLGLGMQYYLACSFL